MIALRRAAEADIAGIEALVDAAYTPWIEVLGRKPGPMFFDYAKAVRTQIVDLHHVGDRLAGMIQMCAAPYHLDIINVAVAPDWQGQGIGRELMGHAEQVAFAHDLHEVRLFTNKLMASNQRLYEEFGYRFDREEDFMGGTIVHMTKQL